ncbi:MAG: chorismate synthase, partial [Planctomycetota bacterium]
MPQLDYHTAGESHGPALISLVQGVPAGVEIDADLMNTEMRRRQGGFGRGGRQAIETDTVEFLSGVRLGHAIGSPIAIRIANKDSRLDDLKKTPPVHRPRPGHADLPGSVKWLTNDCREVLERASARETAARVAAGSLAKCVLRHVGIEVFGFVRSIRDVETPVEVTQDNYRELIAVRDASDVYTLDDESTRAMCDRIREARRAKDTAGGIVEAHVFHCPMGLGSSTDGRLRLDAKIAYAVMGIQAFKGVEIGLGMECARRPGSEVHDPIAFDASKKHTASLGYTRPSNNAGGLEGGMTNGMPVVVRGAMKPIS